MEAVLYGILSAQLVPPGGVYSKRRTTPISRWRFRGRASEAHVAAHFVGDDGQCHLESAGALNELDIVNFSSSITRSVGSFRPRWK
jgi:hypothetical protein